MLPGNEVLWVSALLFSIQFLLPIRSISFSLIALIFFFLALGKSSLVHEQDVYNSRVLADSCERVYSSIVESEPSQRSNSIRLQVQLLPNEAVKNSSIGAYLYFSKKDSLSKIHPGDTLHFRSTLSPPKAIEGMDFDYPAYLRYKQIYYTTFVPSEMWNASRADNKHWKYVILAWREGCKKMIESWEMDSTQTAILLGVVLGIREKVPDSVKQEFIELGVVHVLAVSGLHLGIWYLSIISILGLLPRKWRKFNQLLVIPFLWMVVILTGASPSVTRAGLMFSLISLSSFISPGRSSIHVLLLSMIVLSAVNLRLFFQLGFQLSYLAVLGIIWIYPWLNNAWNSRLRVIEKTKSLAAVSISAQAMTSPLSILTFHRFPFLFLPANLLVVPMISLTVYLGFLGLILHLFGIFPSAIIWILDHLITSILWICHELAY